MSESLKVLHIFPVNYQHRFGGAKIRWKSYFTKWNDPSITHLVLDPNQSRLIDAEEAFNFRYTDNQWISTKWELITWVFRLHKNLRKFKKHYDVLHFHVLWWGGLLMALWAKAHKIPALYESVLFGADNPSAIHSQTLGGIKVLLLRQFKGILAISHQISADYLDQGFSIDQVHTLLNSVDIDLYHPVESKLNKKEIRKRLDLPEEAVILLFVGSVIRRKGIDVLIQAFVHIVQQNQKLFLNIIGPQNKKENPSIDEDFVENLKQNLQSKGLGERVRFSGLIQDSELLADYFRSSDIFIFPSRQEGMPNVVLEAMASELPVITSDIPALEKVIYHLNNGITFPVDDVNALEKAVIALASDVDMSMQLGKKARAYVCENHDYPEWQKGLSDIYHKLLSVD